MNRSIGYECLSKIICSTNVLKMQADLAKSPEISPVFWGHSAGFELITLAGTREGWRIILHRDHRERGDMMIYCPYINRLSN